MFLKLLHDAHTDFRRKMLQIFIKCLGYVYHISTYTNKFYIYLKVPRIQHSDVSSRK